MSSAYLTLTTALESVMRRRFEIANDEKLSPKEADLIRAVVDFDNDDDVDPAEALTYVIGILADARDELKRTATATPPCLRSDGAYKWQDAADTHFVWAGPGKPLAIMPHAKLFPCLRSSETFKTLDEASNAAALFAQNSLPLQTTQVPA